MASVLHLNEDPPPDFVAPQQYSQHSFDLNEPVGEMEEDEGLHTSEVNQEQPTGSSHHQPSKSMLSNEKRFQILMRLHQIPTKKGHLMRGAMQGVAAEFNISTRTASRIWNMTKQQAQAMQRPNVNTRYHNVGRKRTEVDIQRITSLNMGDRTCIRDLAAKLDMSKSSTHRLLKRGLIRPHTNALEPGLKEANKITRLEWILSLLNGATPETKSHYYPMFDFVHIDEKWFNLSKKSQRVYLAHHEKGKYRSASSSKFIPKVMFTAAVARPRFDSRGVCTFDGKIGIFPFTYKEAAKRNSKNRVKGTMVTKLVESINQKVTWTMLIEQIVPAIKAKWSQDDAAHKVIFIQQDNAKAHITQQDAAWQQVYKQDGFTFILIQQSPNSPDLNILDLGFFRSIQSLMHKKMPKDIYAILDVVHEAFNELEPKTLSNVWMSLQYVMNEVMKVKGGNDYDLPHVNKKRLEREGNLPTEVAAPMWAVQQSWDITHASRTTVQEEQIFENSTQGSQAHGQENNQEHQTEDDHFEEVE